MTKSLLPYLLALLPLVSSGRAATIQFTQAPGAGVVDVTVRVLDTFAFAPPSLAGYDLNITYNTAVWSFHSVTFVQTLLGSEALFEAFYSATPTVGNVNLAAVSLVSAAALDSIQPADFNLAVIRFNVIGSGSGNPTLVNPSLLDGFGDPVNPINDGIPEPATAWMLTAGLTALWCSRSKLRRQ